MKHFLLLLYLSFSLALLTSCGSAPASRPFGSNTPKPSRIISASLDSDEILLALVPPERIAALSSLADTSVSYIAEKARPVKGRIKQHTVEEILSYHPDLVILSGWEGADFRKTLTDMGIEVCSYQSAERLSRIPEVIQTLAAATGEEEKGRVLSQDFQERVQSLHEKSVKKGPGRSIYLWGFSNPYGSGDTLFGDMCRTLGIQNTLDSLTKKELSSANMEFLLRSDPDRVLVSDFDMSAARVHALTQHFTDDPALRTLRAIRESSIVPLPPRVLYCPSQYAADAMEELYQDVYDETLEGVPFDPKTAYISGTDARSGKSH